MLFLEYFGRPTTLILELLPEKQNHFNAYGNTTQIVLISVVSFLIMFALVALGLRRYLSRKQYLNEQDVNDFFNGAPNSDDKTDESTWLRKGFPKSHQISKSKMKIGEDENLTKK